MANEQTTDPWQKPMEEWDVDDVERAIDGETNKTTAEDAIKSAFIKTTRSCGIGGPALTVAYAFGVMLDRSPFPATGLRHWAKILNSAADRLEGKSE